jgi:hypothetical protein
MQHQRQIGNWKFGRSVLGRSCLGPKYFQAKVGIGPKYYWGWSIPQAKTCASGRSMLGAKVSVGPKWSWGQTGCEPINVLQGKNWKLENISSFLIRIMFNELLDEVRLPWLIIPYHQSTVYSGNSILLFQINSDSFNCQLDNIQGQPYSCSIDHILEH